MPKFSRRMSSRYPRCPSRLRVTEKELQLAIRLIDDMTEAWPAAYRDTYRDDLLRRIEQKS